MNYPQTAPERPKNGKNFPSVVPKIDIDHFASRPAGHEIVHFLQQRADATQLGGDA
jgi:hypothetical protein